MAGPKLETRQSAHWNTWFEDAEGKVAEGGLHTGETYKFKLDLAPFSYAALRKALPLTSVPVDPSIGHIIASEELKAVTFLVRPIIAEGSGLHVQGKLNALTLTVDLQRLREPDRQQAAEFAAGNLTVPQLSSRVGTAHLSIDVEAKTPGCASIVLSIFTGNGRIPLDHLVRHVAINALGEVYTCGVVEQSEQEEAYGGLSTLLEASFDLDAPGNRQLAAAAFHIFADPGKAGSFVVFADGRRDQEKFVYAWQTKSNLIDYVTKPTQLGEMIKGARRKAAADKKGGYLPAARELAAKLFTGDGAEFDAEARSAENAFKQLVAESPVRPVVVVRVTAQKLTKDLTRSLGQHAAFFLPLGILGARAGDGEEPILKQPITVVQPLPRERYVSRESCINQWTFGVPSEGKDFEHIKPLLANKAPGKWLHVLSELRSYLLDQLPPPKTPAHGLLLLAHHDEGNLWFVAQDERVIHEDVKRAFPPNSVAVFAACSIADPKLDNSVLLKKFNERGVDAMIASPFPIPTTYGTRLALHFPEVVREAMQRSRRSTIAEMFGTAIGRTASQLKDEGKGEHDEIGLEFVLLGNPAIAVCGNQQAPQ